MAWCSQIYQSVSLSRVSSRSVGRSSHPSIAGQFFSSEQVGLIAKQASKHSIVLMLGMKSALSAHSQVYATFMSSSCT